MTTHEYQGQYNEETPQRRDITPGEIAAIDLSSEDGPKQLDIFAGRSDDQELGNADSLRHFTIIDLHNMSRGDNGKPLYDGQVFSADARYLMIQPSSLDWRKDTGYKLLYPGEVFNVGRHQAGSKDIFNLPGEVSKDHFTVAVDTDGKIFLEDHDSTNGTSYQLGPDISGQDKISQESRARELAGFPLRGDSVVGYDGKGNLLEGTYSEPYEVGGVTYHSMVTPEGSPVGIFEADARNESQKLLRERLMKSGSVALEAAGVAVPKGNELRDMMGGIDPIDALSPTVKQEVLDYRRILYNKRQAEKDKDFAQAAEDKRQLYEVYKTLSNEAKTFLGL